MFLFSNVLVCRYQQNVVIYSQTVSRGGGGALCATLLWSKLTPCQSIIWCLPNIKIFPYCWTLIRRIHQSLADSVPRASNAELSLLFVWVNKQSHFQWFETPWLSCDEICSGLCCALLCFVVARYQLRLTIYFRIPSLDLVQSYLVAPMSGKPHWRRRVNKWYTEWYDHHETKHSKPMFIFYGIYCICQLWDTKCRSYQEQWQVITSHIICGM